MTLLVMGSVPHKPHLHCAVQTQLQTQKSPEEMKSGWQPGTISICFYVSITWMTKLAICPVLLDATLRKMENNPVVSSGAN